MNNEKLFPIFPHTKVIKNNRVSGIYHFMVESNVIIRRGLSLSLVYIVAGRQSDLPGRIPIEEMKNIVFRELEVEACKANVFHEPHPDKTIWIADSITEEKLAACLKSGMIERVYLQKEPTNTGHIYLYEQKMKNLGFRMSWIEETPPDSILKL